MSVTACMIVSQQGECRRGGSTFTENLILGRFRQIGQIRLTGPTCQIT